MSTLCSQLSFLTETKKKNETIFTLQYINCRQFVFITEYDLITPYKSFHSLPLVEVGQYFVEVLWWNLGCFPLYQVKYVKYWGFFFTDSSLWIWETYGSNSWKQNCTWSWMQMIPDVGLTLRVSNPIFKNISVTPRRSVLLVEETGVLRENHWAAAVH